MRNIGWAVLLGLALLASSASAQVSSSFVRQWGGGGSGNGQFHATHADAFSPLFRIYVADEANHRVQYFSMNGTYLGQFGQWGHGTNDIINPVGMAFQGDIPGVTANLDGPTDVALGYASYLLPLAVLELYFFATDRNGAPLKFIAAGVPARALPTGDGRVVVFALPDPTDLEGQSEAHAEGLFTTPDEAMWIAHRVAELHQGEKIWRAATW